LPFYTGTTGHKVLKVIYFKQQGKGFSKLEEEIGAFPTVTMISQENKFSKWL